MSQAYSEDKLVEQPAIGLFDVLGWQTVSAAEEVFGAAGTQGHNALKTLLRVLGEQPTKRGRQFKEELIRRSTPLTP